VIFMSGENVKNFFQQPGSDGNNKLVCGGTVQLAGAVQGAAGTQAAAITAPTGGATVDAESRTAITAILVALRAVGIVAT
jgi:hypothetical protein